MKRLLFVSHYPFYGGPQNRALQLAVPLKESGWETIVVLPDEPGNAKGRFESAGIPVVTQRLGRFRASKSVRKQIRIAADIAPDIRALAQTIREQHADVVVIAGLANPHAAIASKHEGIPFIWQIVDTRTPALLRRVLMPYAVRNAAVIMTTGTIVGEMHLGQRRNSVNWVPFYSPVDTSRFLSDADRQMSARRLLQIPDAQFAIGTVGNITPQKGHEYLIEAVALLRSRGLDVCLHILGASMASQLDYRSRLSAQIAESGLDSRPERVLVDPEGDVALLLPAFDVFAMSSVPKSEGVPTALMEALSSGLPSVATDVGGVREVIRSSTGFVVQPLSAMEIANSIEKLILDPETRRAMSIAARSDAVERFDISVSLATHLHALELAQQCKRRD